MNFIKFYLSVVSIVIFSLSVYAQRPGGGKRPDMANMPAEGIVFGQVVDNSSGSPMEYTNVVLFSMRDSSVVVGTLTDEEGKFRIEKVRFGRMYAVVNFMGYHKLTIPDIKITPKEKVVDMGIVNLKMSSTNLEGVEVVADKDHVEFKMDKKVINVSQDLLASGSSAVEVLENTPSVQVDIEGNVSLRGTSNFTVLIDGRPSVLQGSDALQQIPASNIEHIEIITNPSAKYDPDGVGGIINVVMKKQRDPGINGVINTSIGTGNKYKVDALLNYRSSHFNVFGSIDLNYREFSMNGHSEYETYLGDTTNYRNTIMEGQMSRQGFGIKGGFDYFMTERSTLTLSGRYGGYGFGRDNDNKREIYEVPGTGVDYSKSISESSRDGRYFSGNLNYITKFDDSGHKLELMGFYSQKSGDDWEEQSDYITDSNWNINDTVPLYVKSTEDEISNDFRIKADYTKPIGDEGKFEAGFQGRFGYQNEKYIYQNYDYAINEWVENSNYSNEVDFKRNIYSVYSIYGNTLGTFGYQAGLRGEYTDREIKSLITGESHLINRFDIFPSIHVSKQFEGDHQVLASYSRRINRPRGRQLDPFINYYDPYNARQGNPTLEPEYIDSYEISYQKRLDKSFVSFETYYRVTKNKITSVKTLLDNGVILRTYENLNSDYALGFELMANISITKWFLLNASGNVYQYKLDGKIGDEDISTSSTNFDGRLNATFKFNNSWRIQFTEFYRGASVTAQGTREGFFVSNLAVRKDFFDNKFNATLSIRDIFQSANREMTTEGNSFYSHDYFERESPIITLNLSYIINNYKKQRGGNSTDNGGEEMDMDVGM